MPQSNFEPSKNHALKESISERKKKFNEEAKVLWEKDHKLQSNSIWISVRRKLQQFHLSNSYSESFILSEAYDRGIKTIEDGKEIPLPLAWIRLTAYNYICELSREQKKTSQIENHNEISDLGEENEEEEEGLLRRKKQSYKMIRQAFSSLPPIEQKIIQLKVIEGIPFKEIRLRLKEQGLADLKESAIRKRKQRALEYLRENCHLAMSAS